MGITRSSPISAEDLEEYADLLYLKKHEILRLYDRFKELGPEVAQNRNSSYDAVRIGLVFPELRWNPFLDRILDVFSSQQNQKLSFDDILDIYSALSSNCPHYVKARWAFQLFDFDGDGQISREDIEEIIGRLVSVKRTTGSEVDILPGDKTAIAEKILLDLDLDQTGGITAMEFTHAVVKVPDFINSFKLKA